MHSWFWLNNLGVVLAVGIMEILLSVDNAIVMAAEVTELPERLQARALKLGLLGAYVLRIATVFLAVDLISSFWFQIAGAGYLLYVMCRGLGQDDHAKKQPTVKSSFWSVVFTVQFTNLAFSIDNVLAAVALSKSTYIVLAGVFIGILGMWLSSNLFLSLMRRYPWLETVGYALVGFVGAQLLVGAAWGLELPDTVKVGSLLLILAFGTLYFRVPALQKLFAPLFKPLRAGMQVISTAISWFLSLCAKPFAYAWQAVRTRKRSD